MSARVKAKDLRNLSGAELDQKRQALEKELFGLREKKIVGQLDKPHLFKLFKRQIAQIHTVRQEKKNA
ncbi:MAG: 50S ribosomal protein L29 [Candidatus Omnitrophica bacterium]|nr:50S ribosomal protein L29 [Candidatus Omnitrophota bacterium]